MKTRGSFESEWIPLQGLSKHHFNLKHLLGVLNWHLLRYSMHKRSFISLSPLTVSLSISHLPFHSHHLVSSSSCHFAQSHFPFATSPFCLFLHHLLSWMHLHHTSHATTSDLLKDPSRGGWGLSVFCNGPSSIKRRMSSREEIKENWGID